MTFDTGGSPEMLNEKVGRVVPVDDVDEMINAIQDMCVRREKKNDCENLAGIAMKTRFNEYVTLYSKRCSK